MELVMGLVVELVMGLVMEMVVELVMRFGPIFVPTWRGN